MGANSGVLLADPACRCMGIVRLPDFICQPLMGSRDIVTILENLESSPLNIYLMHPVNRRFNRRMQRFAAGMSCVVVSL